MDLATYTRESTRNRAAYAQMREHIQQAYGGQYVALAQGKVIGTATTFDAAREMVNRLDPVPEYYLVFPGHLEPDFDLVYDLSGSW